MPHVIIECSANVAERHDIDALVAVVHDTVVASEIAPTAGCRTRAHVLDHYRVADLHPDNAMVAMVARLGPGRSVEQKQALIQAVLDAAEVHVANESSTLSIAWSMEVQEIDADVRINRNHVASAMTARGSA